MSCLEAKTTKMENEKVKSQNMKCQSFYLVAPEKAFYYCLNHDWYSPLIRFAAFTIFLAVNTILDLACTYKKSLAYNYKWK